MCRRHRADRDLAQPDFLSCCRTDHSFLFNSAVKNCLYTGPWNNKNRLLKALRNSPQRVRIQMIAVIMRAQNNIQKVCLFRRKRRRKAPGVRLRPPQIRIHGKNMFPVLHCNPRLAQIPQRQHILRHPCFSHFIQQRLSAFVPASLFHPGSS